MKILQVCKKFPFPLIDGESIAVYNLSKALVQLGASVDLLSMNTKKHRADTSDLPPDYDHYGSIFSIEVDNTVTIIGAIRNLFSSESYHISRYWNASFDELLERLLNEREYDVVQLETLYLAPYCRTIKRHSNALIVMRAHNVEYEIWERLTANTAFLPKKVYLNYLTKKLKKYEIERLKDYDFLATVSDRDLATFKSNGYSSRAMTSPIGLMMEDYKMETSLSLQEEKDYKVGFIGSLDWWPNIEGLNWFMEDIWPVIHRSCPHIELHIAGRNGQKGQFGNSGDNINYLGEVPDAIAFMKKCDLMIVPLLSGSGMRVKILEGMAIGKAIVTTSLGLEGIHAKDGYEVLVADTAKDFIEMILSSEKNRTKMHELGQRASTFVHSNFSNEKLAKPLLDIYEDMLLKSSIKESQDS